MFSQPSPYYAGVSPFYSMPSRQHSYYEQPHQHCDVFGNGLHDFVSPWELEQQSALRRKRQALAQRRKQAQVQREREAEYRRVLQERKEREEYMRQLYLMQQAQRQRRGRPVHRFESKSDEESDEEIERQLEQRPTTVQEVEEAAPTDSESEYETASEDRADTSRDDAQPQTENDSASKAAELQSKLADFESKLEHSIATYTRIHNNSSSSSSFLESDSTSSSPKSTYNSRVKVLQRTQIELEKLYEQLDALDITAASGINDELRRAKHKLTGRAVQYADKVDELRRELKTKMEQAEQEKEKTSKVRKVLLESVEDEDSA